MDLDEIFAACAEAKRLERERCLAAVEQEPELPGDMPDDMWAAIHHSGREELSELLRIVVRSTKAAIRERIIDGAH